MIGPMPFRSGALALTIVVLAGCGDGGSASQPSKHVEPIRTVPTPPLETGVPLAVESAPRAPARVRALLDRLCREAQRPLRELPRPEDTATAATLLPDERAVLDRLYEELAALEVPADARIALQIYLRALRHEREVVDLLHEAAKAGDAGAVADLLFQNCRNRGTRREAAEVLGADRCVPGRRVTL